MEVTPPSKNVSDERLRSLRWISLVTLLLVATLAASSFVLSFDALCDLAVKTGAIAPGKAVLLPITIDGGILVFSIAACRCSILGEDKRWPVAMTLVSTALSIVGNVAHCQGGFVSALVSAIPPIMCGLALHTLMKQIESHYGLEREPEPTVVIAPPTPFAQEAQSKASKPKKAPSKPAHASRREEVVKLLSEGVSKRSVARQLSVAVSTVRRVAASL